MDDTAAATGRYVRAVGPKPVEDLGKIIARPPFGDLVADDMIDVDSFGAES